MFMKLKSSSPVTWQKIFWRKTTSEKGCYSLIIHTYFWLSIISMHWELVLHKLSEWTIYPSKPRCYGDCMLLVKKTNVNSKNKQDPNPSKFFCKKIQTFFNGFHHYSHYIDYFSINCVPQLQGKGRVVSDPPVQIKHLDHRKKIKKMLVLTW